MLALTADVFADPPRAVAVDEGQAVLLSPLEEYALYLVNRARQEPAQELARVARDADWKGHAPDWNEGLPAGTISLAPKPPLVANPALIDAAREHSKWMLRRGRLDHSQEGVAPQERMRRAGYAFVLPWSAAENIAMQATTGSALSLQEQLRMSEDSHARLLVDTGDAHRGHRRNAFNPRLREVGVGLASGSSTIAQARSRGGWQAVFVTYDFAASAQSKACLTGVVYRDRNGNGAFDCEEGLGGCAITARAVEAPEAAAVWTTTTRGTGGYQLALEPGEYEVAFSKDGERFERRRVTVGKENVWMNVQAH